MRRAHTQLADNKCILAGLSDPPCGSVRVRGFVRTTWSSCSLAGRWVRF